MKRIVLPLLLAFPGLLFADFSSLNMGLDASFRGISIQNNDGDKATKDSLNYYSQQVRFYMRSWLNENVEASFRLQSINIWGLEGTNTPITRYPDADGTPWVEEAYIHMPHFTKRVDLTIGRQPIMVGDGLLVSDDELGFNAIRARAELPWGFDLDLFTAKIAESLGGHDDFNLNGAVVGWDREHNRWELSYIDEGNSGLSDYLLGASTTTASKVNRTFYDLRLFGNLKDAFYKLEVAMEGGKATLSPSGTPVTIKGLGEKIELGAQNDTAKYGRFGVKAVFAIGTGDDQGTTNRDEAFRPTFGKRWDGLQRSGYGQHFAATLSDAYSAGSPFSPTATGLPPGISGIKTMGMGIFTVQKVLWTGALDYYIYNSRTKPTGTNDLGAELDAELTYRYTGFVNLRFGMAYFFPGEVFGPNASRVARYTAEAHVHF